MRVDGREPHSESPPTMPAGPGRQGRRARPQRRTWWVVPFLSGALAVLAVTAVVQVTVLRHPARKPAAASATSRSAQTASASGAMPAQMFPDAMFAKLTADIQHQDEAGFLSLVAPAARPAVLLWWENMQAIGFTTGLIMPTAGGDKVSVDGHGDGTTTVLAGTHSPLDPTASGKPAIPLESYRIGLHFASATATGQITSWKPLGNDPWDQGKLYVRKAANVIVAGPQGDSGVVDETLPIAQAAASYDVGLVNNVNPNDLHQTGFVVFVSGDSATRGGWFAGGPQTQTTWPAEFFGGQTFPLSGPRTSADTAFNIGSLSDGVTGGARVVITPFEDQGGGTQHQETTELVQQFMLDILAADDQLPSHGLTMSESVPSWAVEGLAVAVNFLFEGNPNPAPPTYTFSVLDGGLKALPATFRDGTLPSRQQLYTGQLTTEQNWNEVAASVYEYIGNKYGLNQMFASATLLWTNGTTPFGNVLSSSPTASTFTFFPANTVEDGWKAALAKI
jgi:hypothetical protein